MKKGYKFIALFSAIVISLSVMSACSPISSSTSDTSTENKDSSIDTSVTEIEQGKSGNDNSHENSEEQVSTPENSVEESTVAEISEQPESSIEEESVQESSSEEVSDELSQEVSKEISAESSTYEGYYLDDEQIVEDYHNATEFTDNQEFNALFLKNSLNQQYQFELQNVSTVMEMRNITISYTEKWKNEVSVAYDKLYDVFDGNSEAITLLETSQTEWINGLAEVENQFYNEASSDGAGSEALLSADTAVMNYYRGRAAVLYENIYEITGEFSM